ncbi:hypothetical protein CANARDRAFT_28580 [[Candida] arabinofermentans NRRL YB-2248]|uniref:Calcineurin-like phosphoesterase domain-containing protein n=1 Tax=[Candida] arabinofermentans NRRL YB-2248 TaxID=983967 RepID=A0A1E4T0R8_9ASCO|nr:hypothetical protein CANARDRAFT_28580 [[Candida] arabinofermentans NRRL YB-2248]
MSFDADYYCYYKESVECSLPDVYDEKYADLFDISYLWTEKDDKYKVAPEPGNETFNVLHISDFHVELDYVVGGEANCTTNMCCNGRAVNKLSVPNGYNYSELLTDDEAEGLSLYNSSYIDGVFVKGSFNQSVIDNALVWEPASTFGTYTCDAPEILINNSLVAIAQFQQANNLTFEFSIFTGDLVDHDEVKYTGYEMTKKSEEVIFRDIKYQLKDIPVYSVMGNHDNFPYGEQGMQKYGFNNMFDWNSELMSELWLDYDWIDFETAQEVKEHYCGFSVTTKRGLKIIALNSNVFYFKNHYAYINMTKDPDSFGHYSFLVDELLESESKGQRVWIMYHIPASSDALPIHSKLMGDIIERFSPYTIAAVFNGHTHYDQFQILYQGNGSDSNAKTIDNVVQHTWIMPSVSPNYYLNPSWRYMEVDTETFSVMNAYTYYAKLNETFYNFSNEPEYEFEYSSREAYDIDWPESSPLNATYWHLVAEKMKDKNSTMQMYSDFSMRYSPEPDLCDEGDCDSFWCYVTSFTTQQYANCLTAEGVSDSSS